MRLRVHFQKLVALFRLGFPAAPVQTDLNLATENDSPAHFTKGIPSLLAHPKVHSKLRSLVGIRVQVYFTPLPGCFSPFPLGTILYRSSDIFSLGPWAALIQPEFHVLRPTWVLYPGSGPPFTYGTFTLFGPLSQHGSVRCTIYDFPRSLRTPPV